MATRKPSKKTVGDFIVTDNSNGTKTVQVAAGKTKVTSTGKTAKGGNLVGTVMSVKGSKAVKAKNKEVFDDFEDMDWDGEDFENDYENESIPSDEELADVVEAHLYITRDGIIGDSEADGLQLIDTTGIDESGLDELSSADIADREELAKSLRNSRGFSSKHYFNNTGDYGHVRDLKIIASGDLTRSELKSLHGSSDPFREADNYDTAAFSVLSANRKVNRYGHSGTVDDLSNDELISEGVSY